MAKRIPQRLKKAPLIESVWEVRFSSKNKGLSSLLPGYISTELGFSEVEELPAAHIPREIRQIDPNLIYAHTLRVAGGPFAVQVGDRSVLLSCSRYGGWTQFSDHIRNLAKVIERHEVEPERFSLKYVNILPNLVTDLAPNLDSHLNIAVKVAGRNVTGCPMVLRVETFHGDILNISQIAFPAQAKVKDGTTFEGILVDNDTILTAAASWELGLGRELEHMHDINKASFFDLLGGAALEALEPEY